MIFDKESRLFIALNVFNKINKKLKFILDK